MALHLAASINIPACRTALNKELVFGDRDELFIPMHHVTFMSSDMEWFPILGITKQKFHNF